MHIFTRSHIGNPFNIVYKKNGSFGQKPYKLGISDGQQNNNAQIS